MAKIVILNMVAAAILDFAGYQFLVKPVTGPHFLLLLLTRIRSMERGNAPLHAPCTNVSGRV